MMLSTKERILDAAMGLLDAGGPGAVTLRAVGNAAGISQSAPYRHYQDKRALLEAMVRANLDQMNAALTRARLKATSPFEAFEAVTGLVQAAQDAGELRVGDAAQIATLIFGAVFGMADLAQFGLAAVPGRVGTGENLAPLLLNLLRREKDS